MGLLRAALAAIELTSARPLLARDTALPAYDLPEALLPQELRTRNDRAPYEIHVDPGAFALDWTLPKR